MLDHDKQGLHQYHDDSGATEEIPATQNHAYRPDSNIALLKLEGEPLPALELAATHYPERGTKRGFTGFPIGMALQQLVAAPRHGLVDRPDRAASTAQPATGCQNGETRDPFNIIQLDATAYPGNSGSALYDPETGKGPRHYRRGLLSHQKRYHAAVRVGLTFQLYPRLRRVNSNALFRRAPGRCSP